MATRIKLTEAEIAADKARRRRPTVKQTGFKTDYRMAQLGDKYYRVLGQDAATEPTQLLLDMGPGGKTWVAIKSMSKVTT